MQTVDVSLADRSYPIHIGSDLLSRIDLLLPHLVRPKAAIVTNTTVAPLYLEGVVTRLRSEGIETISVILPDGEQYKTWQTLNLIFDALLANHCERSTTLIALGGGVVGDMTGFAAATYQRGMPFIQIPTTLLAQVDSSVGGKTAVNHPLGKNMIGAFYQPKLVIADTTSLVSLPDRELSAGIAEIIKYGLIRDLPFLEWLEANMEALIQRDATALEYAIARSCINKAEVVTADERESGERAILNFGHTFGHAIEAALGFGAWLHGEAVAVGMLLATDLSIRLGLMPSGATERVANLLRRAKLPVTMPAISADQFISLMAHDKKVDAGKIRFVLLGKIGQAFLSDRVPENILRDVLTQPAIHA
ncbi:MAG TPA: 3-dehydroquinate synthase [Burkholderiales bacterium]|nr:3-dehydroquinate synthase [Burkholderiales bacterium]